jgi:hypothetical protein
MVTVTIFSPGAYILALRQSGVHPKIPRKLDGSPSNLILDYKPKKNPRPSKQIKGKPVFRTNRIPTSRRKRDANGAWTRTSAPVPMTSSMYPYTSPDGSPGYSVPARRISESARDAAEWLQLFWPKESREVGIKNFIQARYNEILNGEFPEKYWTQCQLISSDYPKYIARFIGYAANIKPQLEHPLSKNSTVVYAQRSSIIGAPGFIGVTQNDIFRDLSLCSIRSLYKLPKKVMPDRNTPLFARADIFINDLSPSTTTRAQLHVLQRSVIAQDPLGLDDDTFPLPYTSNYYQQQDEGQFRTFLFDMWRNTNEASQDSTNATHCSLELSIAPAYGKYHHQASSINETFDSIADVFQANQEPVIGLRGYTWPWVNVIDVYSVQELSEASKTFVRMIGASALFNFAQIATELIYDFGTGGELINDSILSNKYQHRVYSGEIPITKVASSAPFILLGIQRPTTWAGLVIDTGGEPGPTNFRPAGYKESKIDGPAIANGWGPQVYQNYAGVQWRDRRNNLFTMSGKGNWLQMFQGYSDPMDSLENMTCIQSPFV